MQISSQLLAERLASMSPGQKAWVMELLDEKQRRETARRLAGSFTEFIRAAWPVVEPKPLVWGRHLDLLGEAIQLVHEGEITRLAIQIPPGFAKSLLVSVLYPSWEWCSRPQTRFLTLAGSDELAIRDALRARRLITSEWYQHLFGRGFTLTSDQNAKSLYENDKGGFRDAEPIGSRITGRRGDVLTIDDPHDAMEVRSDPLRLKVIEGYDQKLSTRLNDMERDPIILIMQRLHDGDLAGHLIKTAHVERWETIILPMEYEGPRFVSLHGLEDWRAKPGELLWPEGMGRATVERLKARLGPHGAAAQLQQRPYLREGAILPRDAWRIWTRKALPPLECVVVSVDTSLKDREKENDPSACTVWGVFVDEPAPTPETPNPPSRRSAILVDGWIAHLGFRALKEKVSQTVEAWTIENVPPEEVIIEDTANGPALIAELGAMKKPIAAYPFNPASLGRAGTRGKVMRAELVADYLLDGRVWVLGKPLPGTKLRDGGVVAEWAEPILDQAAKFPNVDHDDAVDTLTQALIRLRQRGDLDLESDADPDDDDDAEDRPMMAAYG